MTDKPVTAEEFVRGWWNGDALVADLINRIKARDAAIRKAQAAEDARIARDWEAESSGDWKLSARTIAAEIENRAGISTEKQDG